MIQPGRYEVEVLEDGRMIWSEVKVCKVEPTVKSEPAKQTLESIWITQGQLTYGFFMDELARLGFVSSDYQEWTGTTPEVRGLFEYLKAHRIIPTRDAVGFFNVFQKTFRSSFTTPRSLQGVMSEDCADAKKLFEGIFEKRIERILNER